jgi:hypothetical protein
VPAAHQRAPERDGGEGVARVPEGGKEEAAGLRPLRQISSATTRIISERPSAVQAIGVTISVPTPASR